MKKIKSLCQKQITDSMFQSAKLAINCFFFNTKNKIFRSKKEHNSKLFCIDYRVRTPLVCELFPKDFFCTIVNLLKLDLLIWTILLHFTRTFHQAQTLKLNKTSILGILKWI